MAVLLGENLTNPSQVFVHAKTIPGKGSREMIHHAASACIVPSTRRMSIDRMLGYNCPSAIGTPYVNAPVKRLLARRGGGGTVTVQEPSESCDGEL